MVQLNINYVKKGDKQMKIKLPGTMKTKIILLIVLIIFALGIFVYEGVTNREQLKQLEKQQQTELQEREHQKQIQEAIEKEKENKKEKLEGMYNTALGVFYSKAYKKAIEFSNEIIEEDPNYYKGYNLRGIATAYNGNLENGLKDIDKALELSPNYGYARFNKALALELFGHYDESLTWYNKALEVEDYVWSYYGIASIYGRRGNVQKTVEYLKKAVDKDSSVKEAAKEEADFDKVKNSQEFKDLVKD